MSTLIKVPQINLADISADPEIIVRRDDLLKRASEVKTITDRLDADDALSTLKALKALTTEVEAGRKLVKAPFALVAEKIDDTAKEISTLAVREQDRIGALLGAFESAERSKAAEAEAKAREKAAEITRNAEKAAIQAAKAAPDAESRDRAVDAVVEESQAKLVQVQQAAINARAKKPEGARLLSNIFFEVTDIKALYEAHPEMVVLEPNKTVIKSILKTNPNLQVPGLKHWVEQKLSV